MRRLLAAVATVAVAASVCPVTPASAAPKMSITSASFKMGAEIPVKHTCDGADRSPPLRFANVPKKAVELVLIMDDPDAPGGTYTHWVLYGMSPRTTVSKEGSKPSGAHEGMTSFGRTGYGGPCPPPGLPHRYYFKLYALKSRSGLPHAASGDAVREAVARRTLASAQTMGTYCRRLVDDVSSCLIGTWP